MESKHGENATETQLDLQFRKILRMIKVCIPCIMNVDYLTSYRMWIEKLSEADNMEKEERNRYLAELCRQIQNGILEYPLNQSPAQGRLPPLRISSPMQAHLMADAERKDSVAAGPRSSCHVQSYSPKAEENRDDHIIADNYSKGVANDKVENLLFKHPLSMEDLKVSQKKRNHNSLLREIRKHVRKKCDDGPQKHDGNMQQHVSFSPSPAFQEHSRPPKAPYPQHSVNYNAQVSTYEIPQTVQADIYRSSNNSYSDYSHSQDGYTQKLSKYNQVQQTYEQSNKYQLHSFHQPHQSPPNPECDRRSHASSSKRHQSICTREDQGNESSWCDLSEISRTASKLESGDSARSLSPTDSNYSFSQDKLHEVCSTRIRDLITIVADMKIQNMTLHAKAEDIIHNLSEELKTLRKKSKKLSKMKAVLKHKEATASSQWQKTIENMQNKLLDVENENVSLLNEITDLKKQLENLSLVKAHECEATKKRFADIYDKEIDMLKHTYVKQIVDIENKFTRILIDKEGEFGKKMNELKEIYDKKICEINQATSEELQRLNLKNSQKNVGRIPSASRRPSLFKPVAAKKS